MIVPTPGMWHRGCAVQARTVQTAIGRGEVTYVDHESGHCGALQRL